MPPSTDQLPYNGQRTSTSVTEQSKLPPDCSSPGGYRSPAASFSQLLQDFFFFFNFSLSPLPQTAKQRAGRPGQAFPMGTAQGNPSLLSSPGQGAEQRGLRDSRPPALRPAGRVPAAPSPARARGRDAPGRPGPPPPAAAPQRGAPPSLPSPPSLRLLPQLLPGQQHLGHVLQLGRLLLQAAHRRLHGRAWGEVTGDTELSSGAAPAPPSPARGGGSPRSRGRRPSPAGPRAPLPRTLLARPAPGSNTRSGLLV